MNMSERPDKPRPEPLERWGEENTLESPQNEVNNENEE